MTILLSKILHYPQRLVDGIGMYRTVTLALLGITACSLVAGALGYIVYSPAIQLLALVPAVIIGLGLNILFAKLFRVHANHESALITAVILFFLVIPQATLMGNWALYLGVAIAVISKFIFVYRKQHIFNAAAIGAVGVAVSVWIYNLTQGTSFTTDIFSWWVSNPTLFWPILILGSLVVMKVRKWTPVLWFLAVGLVVFMIEEWRFFGEDFVWFNSLELFLFSWPALFLAFFMLTEPFTMPPTWRTQAFYGAVVDALMHTALFADYFPMTPELALIIGNLAVYPFRLGRKLFLTFESKREIATDTYEFVFAKPEGMRFRAGQYLEWMLPHRSADSRGERRYFTIASSPTEDKVRLALKVVEGGSTYKKKLLELKAGEQLIASQLAGDFLLPSDTSERLGFIAGGIGVTPFSSHISFMKDSEAHYDTKLLYCANTTGELAYLPEFQSAGGDIPLETIPVIAKEEVSEPNEKGFITEEMLQRRVPDYLERHWYLSGPPGMVNAYDALLRKSGVPGKQITKDFFPGLA